LKLIPSKFRVLLVGTVGCLTAAAQNTSQPEFRNSVVPFLSKNCIACHNDKVKTASLNLEHPGSSTAVWEKVLDKLSTGRMPPPGSPAPSKAEVASVTSWIEKSLGLPHESAEPGHVTSRRLNRVEYNATVRDLLAVSVRPMSFHSMTPGTASITSAMFYPSRRC
jgi:hypothetical protein